MKKILYLSLNVVALLGIFIFFDNWYSEKIEMTTEICRVQSRDLLDDVVETGVRPAFSAINNLELLHSSGEARLIRAFDFQIDAAVAQFPSFKKLDISESKQESLNTLLYRAKKLRMDYPSTAVDSEYFLEADKVLSEVELEEVKPKSKESIRKRLEKLREEVKARKAQAL